MLDFGKHRQKTVGQYKIQQKIIFIYIYIFVHLLISSLYNGNSFIFKTSDIFALLGFPTL